MAYSRSLMCHLRAGEDLRKELEGKLRPEASRGIGVMHVQCCGLVCSQAGSLVWLARLVHLPGWRTEPSRLVAAKSPCTFRRCWG